MIRHFDIVRLDTRQCERVNIRSTRQSEFVGPFLRYYRTIDGLNPVEQSAAYHVANCQLLADLTDRDPEWWDTYASWVRVQGAVTALIDACNPSETDLGKSVGGSPS